MTSLSRRLLEHPWRVWRPLWSHRERLGGWSLHLLSVTTFGIVTTAGYGITNRIAGWRGFTLFDTSTALDAAIPGWSVTILVYVLFYPLFIALAFSAPRTDRGRIECLLAFQAIMVGACLSFVIFLLAPAEVPTRGQLDDQGMFAPMFSTLHEMDMPFNSWPSLHVLQTVIATWFIIRWQSEGRSIFARRFISAGMWILCTLISLSTLTTKQHYIWDVVSAVILASIIIYIIQQHIDSLDIAASMATLER